MSETPLEARRAWIFQFPVPDPMPNCWMSFRKPEGAMPSSILSSSFKLWTCPSNISLPSNFRLIGPVSSAPDDSLSLSRIMLLGLNKLLTADLAMCWMDMCPGAICTNLKCLSGIMTLLDKVVCIDRGHARKKCKIYIYSQLPSWWATKKQCSCWSKCCDNIFSLKQGHAQPEGSAPYSCMGILYRWLTGTDCILIQPYSQKVRGQLVQVWGSNGQINYQLNGF